MEDDVTMKESIMAVKLSAAFIGGIFGFMFGKLDGLILALVLFVSVDYFTGIMCAWVEKKLSSEVGAKGITKKVTIFLLVAIANIIDTQVLQSGSGIRTAVISYYLMNEGLSITENAARLGLPIPKKLKSVLEQLNEEGTDGTDAETEDSINSTEI